MNRYRVNNFISKFELNILQIFENLTIVLKVSPRINLIISFVISIAKDHFVFYFFYE